MRATVETDGVPGKHLGSDGGCDPFHPSAVPGASLAVPQALLGRCLPIRRMAAPPRPECRVYALHSCKLQAFSHWSRHGAQAVGRTVFGIGGQRLHRGVGDSSVLLGLPLLCQVVLPLAVPIVVARVRGGDEDMVGRENRSRGLLRYHLDRPVCRMWSCPELDKPRYAADAQLKPRRGLTLHRIVHLSLIRSIRL